VNGITFSHTPEDFIEVSTFAHRRMPATFLRALRGRWKREGLGTLLAWLAHVIGCFVGVAAGVYLATSAGVRLWGWFVAAIFAALPLLYAKMLLFGDRGAAKIRQQFVDDPHKSDPTTLTLDDAGCRFDAPHWRCRVAWSAVFEVARSENCIILMTEQLAFVIPRRSFTSADDEAAFVAFANSKTSGNQNL
jgi:hypothetical protein